MAACTVNNVSLVSRDTCGRFCAKPVDTNSKTARLRANTSRTRSCPTKPLLISGIDGGLENSVRTGQFAVKRTSAHVECSRRDSRPRLSGERSSPVFSIYTTKRRVIALSLGCNGTVISHPSGDSRHSTLKNGWCILDPVEPRPPATCATLDSRGRRSLRGPYLNLMLK